MRLIRRVLVACEFSGIVRDSFLRRNIYALSCDLEPSESNYGEHYQGNVLDIINDGWDLMICHPPCTYLANSGARWWKKKMEQQRAAVRFCLQLFNANIPRICLENPEGALSTYWRKPDQILSPHLFGHSAMKKTHLWLAGLKPLVPTNVVLPPYDNWRNIGNGEARRKLRSRTYSGVAEAMATQWGNLCD